MAVTRKVPNHAEVSGESMRRSVRLLVVAAWAFVIASVASEVITVEPTSAKLVGTTIVALMCYVVLRQVMRRPERWTEKHPPIESPSQ